jgi:hypothetical protein
VVVEESSAGHDEAGRIVVELGKAVGRFGHEHAVVGAVASDRSKSFERHHHPAR